MSEREAELYRLRMEREEAARRSLEEENRRTQEGKFCATPFGVDVVGITETVALIGAIVGGTAAKRRKDEVDVLNAKLRQINLQLRQQARAGTLYAPGLTYAPPAEKAAAAAVVTPMPNKRVTPSGLMVSVSMEDDEMNADQLALRCGWVYVGGMGGEGRDESSKNLRGDAVFWRTRGWLWSLQFSGFPARPSLSSPRCSCCCCCSL